MAALPTLFTPSVSDLSLTYLYGIFGTVNGVIKSPSGSDASTMNVLGALFSKFNAVMLAVGVLIVVYVTVVGIMNTAHEGQFMGKNWNNLWIPIRTVLGIAALVPTGSGYSGLQIIMMWVIVQGIGAADTLWGTALNYYNQVGSIYAKVPIPTVEINSTMKGLFQGIMCAKSAATTYPDPYAGYSDIKYFCAINPSDEFCRRAVADDANLFFPVFDSPNVTSYTLGPQGACGKLTVCDQAKLCAGGADSLACKTCTIQREMLKETIPSLILAAKTYIDMDRSYLVYESYLGRAKEAAKHPGVTIPKVVPEKFIQDYCSAQNDPACKNIPSAIGNDMSAAPNVIEKIYWDYGLKEVLGKTQDHGDFLETVVNKYANAVNEAVTEYMQGLMTKSSQLPPELQSLNNQGWIIAGASYFKISQGNQKNLAGMMPRTSYTQNTQNIPTGSPPLKGFRNNYQAGNVLQCLAQGGTDCGSMESGVMAGAADGVRDAYRISVAIADSPGDTDPIIAVMAQGNMYLTITEAIFWAVFGVSIALAIGAMLASLQVFGSGMPQGLMPMLAQIFAVFGPIVSLVISFLVGMGATYAVYVPLIPFMIFTLGAIGWMISTIEAMVAGPLVALGIISPSGQHEIMGKAEPALGLLFSIFLRPSLMIFGMFGAMLLSAQVMKLGNLGFSIIMQTITPGGLVLFKPIIILFTQAAFTVAILSKTFSIIYIIPERVLTWISIQVPHEGAGELQELKAGVDKGAQMAESAAKAGEQVGGALGAIKPAGGGKKDKSATQSQDDGGDGGGDAPGGGAPGGGGGALGGAGGAAGGMGGMAGGGGGAPGGGMGGGGGAPGGGMGGGAPGGGGGGGGAPGGGGGAPGGGGGAPGGGGGAPGGGGGMGGGGGGGGGP